MQEIYGGGIERKRWLLEHEGALPRQSSLAKKRLTAARPSDRNQVQRMDLSAIIAKLWEYEHELKAAGINRLALHNSFARGTEIRGASDVDIIADFDRNLRLSLFKKVHIENRLTDILGLKAIWPIERCYCRKFWRGRNASRCLSFNPSQQRWLMTS